jgi:hypothetical protein
MPKEVEAGAALANCRALINQINAGLSAEKPLVNVSSAAELLFYRFILSLQRLALTKSAPRPRKRVARARSSALRTNGTSQSSSR